MSGAFAALEVAVIEKSGPLTLPLVMQRNAEEVGEAPALTLAGETLTFRELRDETAALARGLEALGLARGERLMLMMPGRLEHWVADAAGAHLGAISCTAYRTLSPEQVGYVAKHSQAAVAVLEGADEVRRWLPVLGGLPKLRKVVVIDETAIPAGDERFVSYAAVRERGRALHEANPAIFEQRWRAVAPEDPVALLYTSGTTGEPKGVLLSHRTVFYEAVAVDEVVPVPQRTCSIAYLPLAHIAEREISIYRAAYKQLHVTICPDPAALVPFLAEARPPALLGVPRVWEKLAAGLRAKLGTLPAEQQVAIGQAHAAASEAFRLRGRGQPVPAQLAAKVEASVAKVLRPLCGLLGLDALKWASSGSAPIPVEVLEYLGGFGIEILEVWGMSETTGCATINTPEAFRLGSVGRALPGVEVKIAEDGEIFVRGPILFMGYLRADGTVQQATDEGGWLATGDVGRLDAEGFLTITDRKKELIITSLGKNVAPSLIEGFLRGNPLLAHALVVGDARPYLTAILALDPDVAAQWARAHRVEADFAAITRHPDLLAELDGFVNRVNERLSRPEQVRKFRVAPEPWLPGTVMITPTMKVRRRPLLEHYRALISTMYE